MADLLADTIACAVVPFGYRCALQVQGSPHCGLLHGGRALVLSLTVLPGDVGKRGYGDETTFNLLDGARVDPLPLPAWLAAVA
jgi:hypothetical protein